MFWFASMKHLHVPFELALDERINHIKVGLAQQVLRFIYEYCIEAA